MGQLGPWQPNRFLLWIDGGGGYLICLKEMVVLGHPNGGAEVDVPILAAIASQHVRIWRDHEGYLIEPLEPVWVDGRRVAGLTWLREGQQIRLATTVQIRFRLPHPYSLTARLEFLSTHRTEPRTDAVLLMGQSCLLGAQPNCHIVCPWLTNSVVLFRGPDGLYGRTEGWLELDGQRWENQAGPIGSRSSLRTERLWLAVEPF